MTLQDAETIIIAAGIIAFFCWLGHIWVWLTVRKPITIQQQATTIVRKTPAEVRDLMPKVGMLQTPPWELIGGDEHTAIFRVSGATINRAKFSALDIHVETRENDGGTNITLNTNPRITQGQRPIGFLPILTWIWMAIITPLVSAGVLISVWNFVHDNPSNPGTRHMVWNNLQIIHILWPPFLFLGVYSAKRQAAKEQGQRFLTALSVL